MPKITAIETAIPANIMPNLALVRIHPDAGLWKDNWASNLAAGDLAEELVAEGIPALKMWPFDRAAHRSGGLHISWSDLDEGMKPLREIRERVGFKLEIMIEGHAFFQLP